MGEIAVRPVPLLSPAGVCMDRRADGTLILRSRIEAKPPAKSIGRWLQGWAEKAPERVFLAERPRPGADWRRMTYAEAHRLVRSVAAWILEHGLSANRPLAILSDNSIDHALFALGAMHVGVPAASISPAYSLVSKDHQKLDAMIRLLDPGAIYVADPRSFGPALRAIERAHSATVVASHAAPDASPAVTHFDSLLACDPTSAVDAAHATVGPHTIAKFLFTSGSTGTPKAVVNTHGMLTSSQEARAALWPFLDREPPVVVDWLPWSHTFGANHNFNLILRNGGSLYIDGGRPAPGLAAITAANLADIGPNIIFNVPRGYDMLLGILRSDPASAEKIFADLRLIFYAAAALPQTTWDELDALSRRTIGRSTPLVSAWGATETSPLATDCHFQAGRSGNIGVPIPGVEIKLVPDGAKLEIRVKGPNVTPGYWKRPDLTAAAFDEEGFYKAGDAVRFADVDAPEKGLFFDGRIAEDFKLSSGTFVSVGRLRMDGIAALDPIAQDIVVTGHDGDAVGFLIFPNVSACRSIAGLGEEAAGREIIDHPAVRARVAAGLAKLRQTTGGGSSRHAARARLLAEPPSVDDGEITDKGYINQRAVVDRRTADVAALHGDDPSAFVAPG